MIQSLSPALLQCLWSPTGTLFSSQLTNFRMPPYCLTVRLARLNLATWAMVSAAKHFSSSLKPKRSFTIVWRPVEREHNTVTLVMKYRLLIVQTCWKWTEPAAFVSLNDRTCCCSDKMTSALKQSSLESEAFRIVFAKIYQTRTFSLNRLYLPLRSNHD